MAVPALSLSPHEPPPHHRRRARARCRQGRMTGRSSPDRRAAYPELAAVLAADRRRPVRRTNSAASPRRTARPRSIALIGLGSGEPTVGRPARGGRVGGPSAHGRRIARDRPARPTTPEHALAVLEGAAHRRLRLPRLPHRARGDEAPRIRRSPCYSPVADDALVERATAVADGDPHGARPREHAAVRPLPGDARRGRASSSPRGCPVDVEVLAEAELEAGGFGGILGVGRGSTRGPRLVRRPLRARGRRTPPRPRRQGHHLRLGRPLAQARGLDGRHEVRHDRCRDRARGRSLAAARLAPAGADHRAGSASPRTCPPAARIRPNDVLRMRGGTTVEVLNTDAEGRLVLADGLVAASEEQPDAIVDVATLTGAARRRDGRPHRRPSWATTSSSRRVVAAGGARRRDDVADAAARRAARRARQSMSPTSRTPSPGNTAGGMLVAGALPARRSSARAARARTTPRSRGRTSTSPGRRTTPARPYGCHREGSDRRRRAHAARAGGGLFRDRSKVFTARNPLPLRARVATPFAGSDKYSKGVAGCPSRTLTLSSWVAEAVATPRPCAPSSSA